MNLKNLKEQEEALLAGRLLNELRGRKAAGFVVRVVTHYQPDADAILGAALAAVAVNGADIIFGSSDDAIGEDQPHTIGIDVRSGARSIKGRESSAAEVIARAMQEIGWRMDEHLLALIREVTAIDTAAAGQRAWLNLGSLTQNLRDAGWSDMEIINHVIEAVSAHLIPPEVES